jgi:transforming growth factor-beta-induced protein
LLAIAALSFTSCKKEEDPEVPKSIVETAQATADLSILVDALVQADLVTTLEGDGPFTVFAPNNAAFQDLLDSNNDWNSLSDIDNATLTQVLLFHVVSGNVMAEDLSDTYVSTVATGPNSEAISLQVQTTGGVMFNGSAMPITTDVEASNGVVHIIDRVMLPPTVVNHAVNGASFTSLVAALTRSDLNTNYVDILSGTGPFTVFAPTNEAFQALLDSNNDWNSLADIDVATLEAVLNYHVVSGANVQADQLTDGQTVTTLGGTFTVDLTNGAVINTATQNVNIIATDVQGTNGVVHVVDAVLLP